MSEFDKWNKYNLGYTGKQAFEAGQQSQQVKIDELKKKLDCCREENKTHLEKIDEAIARCKFLKTNGGDRRTLEDIELILKGNKDEN